MATLESIYQSAVAAHQAGRLEEAEAVYTQIVQSEPGFARAWHLLGVIAQQRGDSAAAIPLVERAIQLDARWAVFFGNLGSIYRSVGRKKDAETALRRAIEMSPQFAMALTTYGFLLSDMNRCDEALHFFQRAMDLNPRDSHLWAGVGYAYSELGNVDEAIAAYEQAFEISGEPSYRVLAATQLPLVYESTPHLEKWRSRLIGQVKKLLAEGVSIDLDTKTATPVFSLPHQGKNDLAIQCQLARLYRAPELLPPGDVTPSNDGKRVRVGFISSFFCHHTIGKLVRGLISRLSHERLHITLLSIEPQEDEIWKEMALAADRVVVTTRHLPAARQAILACDLDVLFYTDIGMDGTTYTLAHSRLAPVQCVTWGHPITTGLATMDYFISSDLLETSDADSHYSEKLVRLPSLTFCYARSSVGTAEIDRTSLGLDADATLYVCPQSIYKFHPDFDQALANILRRDPNGRVVLIRWAYQQADDQLRQRFAKAIPDVADRIVFIRRLQPPEFMSFLTMADVALDPYPYGGGNSSLEAYSVGLPVVTLPTEFLRGRITQAFCRKLGVEECIARDEQDYVNIAVRLGIDAAFRRSVCEKIEASTERLFGDVSAVRDLEEFLFKVGKSSQHLSQH